MEEKFAPDCFVIELAEIGIELHPINKEKIWNLCFQYVNEKAPVSLSIAPTEKDLEDENERAKSNGRYFKLPYPKERHFIYRMIAENLPLHNTVLMHAVAVAVDGKAFIFTGPSGVGKTTHAGLWKSHFNHRLKYISDDKPLVRITDDEVRVFGSPWTGKENLHSNISAPLKSIFFINQAKENSLAQLSKSESWDLILNQVYRSKNALIMEQTLSLMDKMISRVPIYRLDCNTEQNAVNVAYLGSTDSHLSRL